MLKIKYKKRNGMFYIAAHLHIGKLICFLKLFFFYGQSCACQVAPL